jgi:hypothetical protein
LHRLGTERDTRCSANQADSLAELRKVIGFEVLCEDKKSAPPGRRNVSHPLAHHWSEASRLERHENVFHEPVPRDASALPQ